MRLNISAVGTINSVAVTEIGDLYNDVVANFGRRLLLKVVAVAEVGDKILSRTLTSAAGYFFLQSRKLTREKKQKKGEFKSLNISVERLFEI